MPSEWLKACSMNYVGASHTLWNLKSIGIGGNSFHDLVMSKPFGYEERLVPSLALKVLCINQNPIVNVELSSFFNVKDASFVVDAFEDVVDMGVYCSYSVQPVFCSSGSEFVVVVEMYGKWIKTIDTSVLGEFMSSDSCGTIGTFCKR